MPRGLLDHYNPAATQRRLAATPSGRQVWVEITANDRVACIDEIGKQGEHGPRYREFMRRRENGESYERLERDANCDPDTFRETMAALWTVYETMLQNIADRRAKLLP